MQEEQILYAIAGVFIFIFVIVIPVLYAKRGKVIRKQKQRLSKIDNSTDTIESLKHQILEKNKEQEKQNELHKEEVNRLKNQLFTLENDKSAFAKKLVHDHVLFESNTITASNYVETKHKLEEVFDFCEVHHFDMKSDKEEAIRMLKHKFEEKVRKDLESQKQSDHKAVMQEESDFKAKVQDELNRLNQELNKQKEEQQQAIQGADEKKVELLQQRIQITEKAIERATQQVKDSTSGFVFVVSNFGSMGEGIYKIGYTQSEEPLQEIEALSTNSTIPFPFDVHAVVPTKNVFALMEHLRFSLNKTRVNRVNFKKDFYNVELGLIIDTIKEKEENVTFQKEPEALEYFQSMEVTADELQYLSETNNK
ncbi:GIY-YIG nuclease family protein [Flammeovirga agarivorans]|uniref:Bacteriophage T5 Orf172 DNA-binding domain-containing protein n=1 Tax=Flammeovirga agarivorans TaxID=2726742 RepID=A0A7X8SJY1_9BACT|nr:GIY-YIG nuclease family protein [Flammeovirga agarivorans]NLR91618.1 hypothetical protein [Flammeovirga agarivorans]